MPTLGYFNSHGECIDLYEGAEWPQGYVEITGAIPDLYMPKKIVKDLVEEYKNSLLADYLAGEITQAQFKTKVDNYKASFREASE